jgi:AraC-like DNA-binding protein
MPAVQLRFPARYLQRKPVMADATAAQQAVEQCEREHAMQGRGPDNLVQRVRALLTLGPGGFPALLDVSSKLFISSRTLKRKLQEAGTSFQQLLDEQRRRAALRLLENPELGIQRIAELLGYKDPPSFTRAFQRWCGKTPSQARADLSRH